MRVVTAKGTILDLFPGKTVIHPKYYHEPKKYLVNDYQNDLFFAMRGAGSSFAIATEFLYQIYNQPETSPAVILVWISDMRDLWRIQEAAYETSKYSIAISNEYAGDFWNSFKTRIVEFHRYRHTDTDTDTDTGKGFIPIPIPIPIPG